MPAAAEAREALDLEQLRSHLPPGIPVIDMTVEDYVDTTGDPALMIRLVIAEETDIEHVSGKDVGDLKMAFREALQARGITLEITLFPYFELGKPSEWKETDEESE